jgi:hypothetical protein
VTSPGRTAAQHLVLVTTATVPGMRRLEGALEHLAPHRPGPLLAVRGAAPSRWPAWVRHSTGPAIRPLLETELPVPVPHDAGMAVYDLEGWRC